MILGHIVSPQDGTITILTDSKQHVVDRSHCNYDRILELVDEDVTEDELLELISVTKTIDRKLNDFVEIRDGQIFFKGIPISNGFTKRLIWFISNNRPYNSLVAFFTKLMENPSRQSTEELFDFLEHKGLPISADGNFYAYKAVNRNWKDKYTNQIWNRIGDVVEVKRNQVDDDRSRGCSYGLHAGTLEYARRYGGHDCRLLLVEINPADVVSVPLDCSCQKMRVYRYKVIKEIEEILPDEYYGLDETEIEYDEDGLLVDQYDDEY